VGAWAPMAEQKAVARFLGQDKAIDNFLHHFKSELEIRLQTIYRGVSALREEGFPVEAIAPEGAIYLTVKIDLVGQKLANGKMLTAQSDVTDYLLNEARLALVPFYAFGAPATSPWYRLSVGACKKQEIPEMLEELKKSLIKLK